jgi:hypothetical protein
MNFKMANADIEAVLDLLKTKTTGLRETEVIFRIKQASL